MAYPTSSAATSPNYTVSTGQHGKEASLRRFTIYFQDDAVRERSQDNIQQLLQTACSGDATSSSALLARKALKYRKVYARMEGVDVTSPEFNASKFLGVNWCKTPSLRAYCEATRS